MRRYLLKRLSYLIPVMFGVSIVTFALIRLAPGDPAELILRAGGFEPTQEEIKALREELGLDVPVYIQYIRWLWNVFHLNLGESYYTGEPVVKEILIRFPATLELAGAAIALVILFALPAGILAALYRRAATDHLMRLIAILGASLPGFWLGLLLIYLFAVKLKLLPVMGKGSLEHLILPAVTLSFGMAATYARLLRASMLEVLGQDYITVARAKGLDEEAVVLGHALKNALLPVITMLGLSFGHLLGGTVIIETVFAWPGVGRFCLEAIFHRDYPVVQAYALFMAVVFVLANLVVDLSYRFLDPRVEVEEG